MVIQLLVRQGGKVMKEITRVVHVYKQKQMWTVSYKGKQHQVLGGGRLPYQIVLQIAHTTNCKIRGKHKDCPACNL